MRLSERWRFTRTLFKDAFKGWQEDGASKMSASLAYYTAFSLAPLLLIVIAVAGFILSEEAAKGEVVTQIGGLIGFQGAKAVEEMIEAAGKHGHGIIASIVGSVTLLFGATGVFVELQDSLNRVWKVDPKKHSGWKEMIKDRFMSFAMILGIAFLLLVSLLLSAAIQMLSTFLGGLLPGFDFLWQILTAVVSFAVVVVLFAFMFKMLPDTHVEWRDVWPGAALTALLFTIGKTLIGMYLGKTSVVSVYGAAGSLALILLWVYYTAQILFFGAEFTRAFSKARRSRGVSTATRSEGQAGLNYPSRGAPAPIGAHDSGGPW